MTVDVLEKGHLLKDQEYNNSLSLVCRNCMNIKIQQQLNGNAQVISLEQLYVIVISLIFNKNVIKILS